jgi:Trypsin-like peptidase domain
MHKIATTALAIALMSSTAARTSPLEDTVESTFRPAIVKIDVSSNTTVLKDGINICRSEGTGFLVSSDHVVTAEHVYVLAPECGERIIIVKSNGHHLQKLANIVAAKDDVGLLKVDGDFPDDMCALGLNTKDVFGTEAIRFGIPGGFDEPGPASGVKIGTQTGQFAPLILLSPAITEKGESGGPVIYLFNVVGITRARHAQYPAYSFMTVGSTIRALMAANSVRPSGHICNPVESSMWTQFNGGSGGFLNDDSWKNLTYNASKSGASAGTVFGTIKMDSRVPAQDSSITPDLFKSFVGKFGSKSIILTPNAGNKNVSVQANINSLQDHDDVARKVARATNGVSQQLQETLWNDYVTEARKAGKWKTP